MVIFKGDFACLYAINLTAFTTGDFLFMGGTKFLPVWLSPRQMVVTWNTLIMILEMKNIVQKMQKNVFKLVMVATSSAEYYLKYYLK